MEVRRKNYSEKNGFANEVLALKNIFSDPRATAVIFLQPHRIPESASSNVFISETSRLELLERVLGILDLHFLMLEKRSLNWEEVLKLNKSFEVFVQKYSISNPNYLHWERIKRGYLVGIWTMIIVGYTSVFESGIQLQERLNSIKGKFIPVQNLESLTNPDGYPWLKWDKRVEILPLKFIFGDRRPEDESDIKLGQAIRYCAIHVPDNFEQAVSEVLLWKSFGK